ncbi:bcl-2-like protein 13 isoform X1 [Pseudophryne corroboree]|uniref:bcl-2-like protein 13 isoform X1 n=1 Tax=Pseudophryne corroboree TaxID=495146 RepID=UPI00308219A0
MRLHQETGSDVHRRGLEPGTSGKGVPQALDPPALAGDKLDKIKAEIDERLKRLEEEISAVFPSTGFDTHTSPVFSPVSPETSIEECLAPLVERMRLEIREPLSNALQRLLSGTVTYDAFKKESDDTVVHTSGWNKVLVPLFLLQRLLLEQTRRGDESVDSLVQIGVSYIEEVCADYIIQQGGWGTVFSLETEEEDVQGLIAEDSNDIYILTSDNSEQVSPPESLAVSSSWHTESLPTSLGPESWQQVAMDPEELKSLDSNGGGEERSENNSSNSDIVHVEKEEIAEVIEEAAGVEQRFEQEEEEDVEDEEREILMVPSAATAALGATSPPTLEEEELKIPPPTVTQPELPNVDIAIKGVLGKGPPSPPEEPKEEFQVTPTSEAEKVESPIVSLLPQQTRTGEEKPVFLPEGKSILLYGGAAAVAILAVAVGMVMALRKK